MKQPALRRVAIFALAVALLAAGCSDNSTQPKEAPKPRYPEATTKEIVISNLLKSYEDRNIVQYEKLLHDQYVWYNKSGEVPEYYTRNEDVDLTGHMFDAAQHQSVDPAAWLDELDLTIVWNVWTAIPEFNDGPCEACWETTRDYILRIVTAGGATTIITNDLVRFVVVPMEVSGRKVYQIIACYEMSPV